jgi:uncharacterized protein
VIIGALKIRLKIIGAKSLKEKRKVIKSIKDRIAEVDDHDLWQASTLGLAVVSNESAHVNAMLDKIRADILDRGEVEILQSEMEIIHL